MSDSLKVLIWYWGRKGAGPKYTLELAREIANYKDIDLFLSISRQSQLYDEFDDLPAVGRFDVDTYQSISGFLFSSLRLKLIRRNFAHFIRENRIDVVFCTMDCLWNTFIVGAIHDAGALYMLAVHDSVRHPGEDQYWRQWLLNKDISSSDAAIVLTQSVGQSLELIHNYPKNRIYKSVLGHFGDYVREKPRELSVIRPVRVLFFGRILPYKGLDILLDAMFILRRSFPDIKLEIWGAGDVTAYKTQISQLEGVRLENRWIEENEIKEIFDRNDLLVLPYREASQSGSVGTAMAYGMPCVITPIPGLCDQISDYTNGIISAATNAESLAMSIANAISSSERYSELSRGCLHTAREKLSWKNSADSVVSALFALHAHGPRFPFV